MVNSDLLWFTIGRGSLSCLSPMPDCLGSVMSACLRPAAQNRSPKT